MRAAIEAGVSTTAMVASMTSPTITALARVPMPTRSRSGIHRRRTATPTTIAEVPIARPVRSETPWWRTSHGGRPRSALTMQAMATPKSTRPASSRGTRRPSSDRGGNGSIRPG